MSRHLNLRLTNGRTNALYLLGLVGVVAAIPRWDWAWAAVSLGIHVFIVSLFSAVVHRYFCHRAYDANPTLAYFLSILPVAYGYATPIAWASLHSAHHAFPDSPRDTHVTGWRGIFTAAYRTPSIKFALNARWFHDRRHELLFNNALGVVLAWFALLALIGLDALIWVGLVPMFMLHFFNAVHRVVSHQGARPLNLWFLEYVIPFGGEWIHDEHHVDARKPLYANRWYEIDSGSLFVRLLARTAK